MRIITVNLPVSYINAIKTLTGENGLYPSRSELIRVAVREFIIKELEDAKSFAEFNEKMFRHPFKSEYPDPIEEEFKPKERMASEIKYKTMAQEMFQRVPTMEGPIEICGRIVENGDQFYIDGEVWNKKWKMI